MTPQQARILAFIEDYWTTNWTSPSMREIANAIGISSPSTVYVHINGLVRDGYLERKEIPNGRVAPRVIYRPIHG